MTSKLNFTLIDSGGWRISESVGEILNGLQCYFDKALPAMLLYKNEREQFEKSIKEDVSPSSVYGAEHFLRLFGTFHFNQIFKQLMNQMLHVLICNCLVFVLYVWNLATILVDFKVFISGCVITLSLLFGDFVPSDLWLCNSHPARRTFYFHLIPFWISYRE